MILKDIYLRKNKILDGVKKYNYSRPHYSIIKYINKTFQKFKSKQAFFFDAPVSGGEIGAQRYFSNHGRREKNKFKVLKKV